MPPSCATISAVARPMPLAAAVITATRSWNRIAPPFPALLRSGHCEGRGSRKQRGNRSMAVQIGIHLPQAGSKASPTLIRDQARRAEALGFSDLWVSEHIIVPRAQFPRSPLFYDP